ncbi:MAG TPA: GtrA family protein [Acetobacteraceae bacterium]
MKIVKFFFVGSIAAAVDIGLFYLGAGVARWNYLLVGTVSFILATLVNYAISVRVVFHSGARFSRHHEVLLVFLVSLAGLAVNQAILYVGISRLSIGILPAKLLATGGVFLWNYHLRSRFVFAGPRIAVS